MPRPPAPEDLAGLKIPNSDISGKPRNSLVKLRFSRGEMPGGLVIGNQKLHTPAAASPEIPFSLAKKPKKLAKKLHKKPNSSAPHTTGPKKTLNPKSESSGEGRGAKLRLRLSRCHAAPGPRSPQHASLNTLLIVTARATPTALLISDLI